MGFRALALYFGGGGRDARITKATWKYITTFLLVSKPKLSISAKCSIENESYKIVLKAVLMFSVESLLYARS